MEKKLHLICNSHIDPVWLWRWNEGAAEALSTFRVAADFCEKYDGFIFNHNEALLYKWVEEYDPRLFKKIQDLVKQGKWHIMGGWFLQPDCNMPSGESFVRQILEGRSYFKEKFGAVPETAINFDSFGHTRGLVQILKKAGYNSYIICRPSPKACNTQSDDFEWIGFDGSSVTVHRSDENYNSIRGKVDEKLNDWISKNPDREVGCFLWGIGDHGGGPSRKDMESLEKMAKEFPQAGIVHSTPEAYFGDLRKSGKVLPRFDGSLHTVAEGCYTSQIRVKQRHRKLENDVYMAEKMLSHAALGKLMEYPAKELKKAQYDLMFSQFHDALPGSAIKSVEEDTLRVLGHGLEITSRLKTRAFFALCAGQKKVVEGETPVLVYNPHPFPISGIFECELVLPSQNWNNEFSVPMLYRGDKAVPCQAEQQESHFNMDWRKRVVFYATLLPSCMNRFDCRFKVYPKKPVPEAKRQGNCLVYHSDRLDAVINCSTGLVDRYAVDGVDFLKKSSFVPVVLKNGYNSWGFQKSPEKDTMFSLLSDKESAEFAGTETDRLDPVRVVEDGPVRTVVEALFRYGNSYLCQQYFLPKHGTELQVRTVVYWNEKDRMLKLSVPTTLEDADYVGQTAFGTDRLKNDGSEDVSQKWCGVVSERNHLAFTCVNDGIYGSDCKNGKIRLSLLRSPAYAASDFICGKAIPPDRMTFRMDQGERIYNFWFNAGPSDERLTNIDQEALLHNEKPYALPFCPSGEGNVPEGLIEISRPEIVLSAFKPAENRKGYIIRLFNSSLKEVEAELRFPLLKMIHKVRLNGSEVKTLHLDADAGLLQETDLVENR